ncbi:hypothetical protein PSTG_06090 [Puccinia striiformis f. sp. tritici PST-78]|uniref:DUF659 domain-containing protein n=1 Tax=Puccinia striiformis f. sp. tritici PST-78 TaxID=1165861 RepID=A0A0L0VN88_9BASI|nr:hypothetical protein PSTG_06090 [Puccinia striiformis f. sp. tritici PST-78]
MSSSQPPPQQEANTEEAKDHDKSGEDNIPPTDEEELGETSQLKRFQQSECRLSNIQHTRAISQEGQVQQAYDHISLQNISRPTKYSSCSNLLKHATGCMLKQSKLQGSKSLTSVGIMGTSDIDPKEVPQLCAEAACLFLVLVNRSHKAILHPTIAKHLPTQKAEHKDALCLGVNGWQSPNGFAILGVVIYRLTEDQPGGTVYKAMPLDFLRLTQSHTGVYIAQNVQLVVKKFGIADKICGIVTNNATNNEVMGKTQWICCFAHILNLIAQAILWPFGAHKIKRNTETRARGYVNSDADVSEEGRAEGQIRLLEPGDKADALGSQDGYSSDVELVSIPTNDGNNSLDKEDIDRASEEDENNCYTSDSCKETLAQETLDKLFLKFHVIAKKLRYSPNSKAECKAAILIWQRHKKFGITRQYYVDKSDFTLARDLIVVLNLFYEITLQVSTGGFTRIASVVIFIN